MTQGQRLTRAELGIAAAVLRSADRPLPGGYKPETVAACARVADLLEQWARSIPAPKWAPDWQEGGASGLGERGG